MQFVGHLDLIRAWQKIFRRSGIPIAYSEGFNPHQVFSIGAPLALGTTGDGEYLDLKLKVETYELKELIERLNKVCPEGIEVVDAVELIGKQTAAMAACKAASYVLTFSDELAKEALLVDKINAFVAQDEIIIQKKTKKGKIKDLDLKPGIYSLEVDGNKIMTTIATGSSLNIKPELLMKAIFDYVGVELEAFSVTRYYEIHRREIFASVDPFMDLIEIVKA